ncbi:hypothetical protein AN189_11230 [Loktanella sp. 3ANDIMAR09]|uniref:TIGR03032 family protein n=1 Tax=Loktanella sp. 3ANDIMAR09 TaxID=1225657 RepID=UPI000707F61B|nr:TIGR03032 family protein [Loktanella sp. 3ANDIMAR09]KQI68365.1 hypothetical protein AN189_11230 [Loktanella sp. 3ANDIMAR09]
MDQAQATDPGTQPETQYSVSPGFADWCAGQHICVAMTSYQSGRFYLLGQNPETGGLMVNERVYQKAMGLATPRSGTILLATLFQITRFENVLHPGEVADTLFDGLFVPRVLHTTGQLDVHDVGMLDDGRIVFANTSYNCLATVSDRHSFSPYWRPQFVSDLVQEDRCHLNGLAMGEAGTSEAGRVRYVTACSRSDTIDGWRDRRQDGGVVIDVDTGAVVCSGLSMPHSPRLHEGRLYVLNSGTGELGWVDTDAPADQAFRPIKFLPGFARGLSFHGHHAVIGLSKPRYERFEGLALDRRLQETDSDAWCGIQVVDLRSGKVDHWFRIDGTVTELYDTAVIGGTSCAMSLGFTAPDIVHLITLDKAQS